LLYAKDNQEREALYYQEQIDDLQNQVDQIQAELASKRERQLAEAEALSQTKEGILQEMQTMALQAKINSEAERSNLKAKVEKGKKIMAHLAESKAYETDYFSALKALK
jgi:hypothetical protein